MPGPGRFTELVADFLDESSVESPVLEDIASLVLCKAMHEAELAGHLPGADAILLFHDIPHLGEASFAREPRCRCVVRAGVGYNNVDLEVASRHGVVVCNVPDYGTEEVADHAIMFLLALAPAGTLPRGHPSRDLALPDGRRHPAAARQDLRAHRLRLDRHCHRAAGEVAGTRRRLP